MPERESLVTFLLEPFDGGTELTLIPAAFATSPGSRIARLFPHLPTVACDMIFSGCREISLAYSDSQFHRLRGYDVARLAM